MKSLPSRVTLTLLATIALTGCVNREQADAKLGKACAAAIGVLLPEGQRIDSIKETVTTASPVGPGYRHVTIKTAMIDGWLESENDYECTFEESFGFLNSGFTASLYEAKVGNRIVGKAGNEIMGSAEDHMKVIDAVRKALYK